jgi:glycosyltransferase involved in cell wall biosynthesis
MPIFLDYLKIRAVDTIEILRNDGFIELIRRLQDKLIKPTIGLPKVIPLSGHNLPDGLAQPATVTTSRGQILVIDARIPMVDRDSGSQRIFAILKIMRSLGYSVTFIAANCEHHEPYVSMLEQYGINVLYSPLVSSLKRFLKESGKRYDIIWISRAQVARKYLKPARRAAPNAMTIFDTVDLQFLRRDRYAKVNNSAVFRAGAAALKKYEMEIASEADATVVVSEVEKKILNDHLNGKVVEVVSNVHERHKVLKGYDERSGIIFIGCFRHPPNVDAVCHYVEEIFPEIKRALPDVTTYLVGSDPPPKVRDLAGRDVVVTGYVADLGKYLEKMRISIAPLRYGAGVKGKINTAMAWGVPVVTTLVGAEGMYLVNGVNALIADEPKTFANAVIRAYTESELWERLSENALLNVRDHFSILRARDALRDLFAKATH